MWTYRPTDTADPLPGKQPPVPRATNVASSVRTQPGNTDRRGNSSFAPLPSKDAAKANFTHSDAQHERVAWASGTGKPPQTVHTVSPKKPALRRTCVILGGLYLCGLAGGALFSRALSEPLMTYAQYFASIDLGIHTAGSGAMVFSVGFLSLFCQLTLVLMAGFCVLGVGLIPITMALKGVGTGVFTALLYQEMGAAKGMLLQALVFWIPEVLGSLLVILLSGYALQLSSGLLRCCLGHSAGPGMAAKRLLHRYLAIAFATMGVCGLSVALSLVFGRLF